MVLRLATRAMGTRFELVLDADGDPRLRAAGEAALLEIEEADHRLSLFRRDSLLAHVNRSAYARPVRLDADTFELFAAAEAVARASDGAFDPTVAPLLRALGLHDGRSTAPALSEAAARAAVGWRRGVVLDPARRTVRFLRPDVTLDLGGIAKGHGLDLAAAVLRESGVTRALIHGGTSTVVGLGAPPGSDGWRVAIGSDPDPPVAVLRDACLSVSAPAGRVARRGDDEIHHVLDPRTASPAVAAARLAAVIAPTATLADAWSTALLVDPELAPTAGVESLVRRDDPPRWRRSGAGARSAFHLDSSVPA